MITNDAVPASSKNTFGLISLVSSLVGLAVCGAPLGLAAVVAGAIALSKGEENKTMPIIGIFVGLVDVTIIFLALATGTL